MKEFYPTLNAFLAAARSVLYVARHEYGWNDLRAPQRKGVTPAEIQSRKRFDEWYDSAPEPSAVEAHPLTDERHCVVHRGGQAGFFHRPLPIGGLAVSNGDAFGPGLFLAGGKIGLPLEDANQFFYTDPYGVTVDGVECCSDYLKLVEAFMRTVEKYPWR